MSIYLLPHVEQLTGSALSLICLQKDKGEKACSQDQEHQNLF